MSKLNYTLKTMAELRSSYASVTARTSSLHDACDRALAYQTALAAGAEQIRTNLHFFKQADIIMKVCITICDNVRYFWL